MRVRVASGKERMLITPPKYGMYSVCAQVNDIGVVKCPLELGGEAGEGGLQGQFSPRVDKKKIDADPSIKVFICSPGNPTGMTIAFESVKSILDYENFKGIVVIDEAYVDFDGEETSAVSLLVKAYANLCIMQTLKVGLAAISRAWNPNCATSLNSSSHKAPHNISQSTAHLALSAKLSPSPLVTMKNKIEILQNSQTDILRSLAGLCISN
ncbi:hypothetical protein D9757_014232 [Collybiopsis confluens]|uniref:histidinol-phosphate transaminase n=1 Tax=Collybiopsis confluens TaxID=2823264 RepID=A0A8H5G1C0_9AGAR|nr:hypothetical protein D9757_014232 [Collybiopsis confluens]